MSDFAELQPKKSTKGPHQEYSSYQMAKLQMLVFFSHFTLLI